MSDDVFDHVDHGHDHEALRELLGAYALGQLDPAETAAVEAHVAGCASCPAELAELSPAVTALRSLRPATLPESVPPADLGDRVLDGIRQQRWNDRRATRRRRVLASLAVAAAVAIAFGVGLRAGPGLGAPPVRDITLTVAPGVTAEAGLVKHTWGTELKLDASGLAAGEVYAVEFVRDDGRRVSAGGIIGTGTATITCSVNAAVPIDDAAELVITDPAGATVMSADLT